MKTKSLLFALATILMLGSCQKDLGEFVTVTIPTASFDQLRHDASVDIVLSQGAGRLVEFEGYDLVLNELSFDVNNGKLTICQHGLYGWSGKSTIYITVPDLSLIDLASSGDIYGDNRFKPKGSLEVRSRASGDIDLYLDVPDLYTSVQGSGEIRLRGYADHHEIELDGSGRLYAFGLQTYRTRITQFASGDAELNATNSLYVRLRGSGDIFFIGNPFVDHFITGSGRLINAN